MKRIQSIHLSTRLIAAVLVFPLSSTFADDLAGYTPLTSKVLPAVKLVNPGFQDGAKGWNLPEGYSID